MALQRTDPHYFQDVGALGHHDPLLMRAQRQMKRDGIDRDADL